MFQVIWTLALLWLGRLGVLAGWPTEDTGSSTLVLALFCLDVLILGVTVVFAVRLARAFSRTLWFWLLTLSVVIGVFVSANHWVSLLSDIAKPPPKSAQAPPVLETQGSAIFWSGPIDFDSFEALKNTLLRHPEAKTLILDSPGGRISAARGMARLVSEARLDTTVNETCSSACTLVFIAGEKRKLEKTGKLGFHGYRLLSGIQTLDAKTEQQRDRETFLKRGVDASFLDRAYAVPFEDIWYPDAEELRRSGVATN